MKKPLLDKLEWNRLRYSSHPIPIALGRLFGRSQKYDVGRLQRTLGTRYAKPPDSWVLVHTLQSENGGGILDPDDKLNDVADDREQILAIYEEEGIPHHGADGSSGGTSSPEIFQGVEHKFSPFSRNDIEVTDDQIAQFGPSPLQVRRGSEPALNCLIIDNPPFGDSTKRWSAAPVIDDNDNEEPRGTSTPRKDKLYGRGYKEEREDGCGGEERIPNTEKSYRISAVHDRNPGTSAFSRFSRDGNRLSVQMGSEQSHFVKWLDAAERVFVDNNHNFTSGERREPLGGTSSPICGTPDEEDDSERVESSQKIVNKRQELTISLKDNVTPLGIHVVPCYDRDGRDSGLMVQRIEPGSRVDKDGRLAVFDRIVEINGIVLNKVHFQRSQEIFRDALKGSELHLVVMKQISAPPMPVSHRHFPPPPPPIHPRDRSYGSSEDYSLDESPDVLVEGEERVIGSASRVATVTPTKKAPITVPSRTPAVLSANTRKIGKVLEVELIKGSSGLGFSITTRDNPAGGKCPIYIKNILPKGAAVEDGRLKSGDRLLEVNGTEMTGRTQLEAVNILRNIHQGGVVKLMVSRQEKVDESVPSPKLPRQLPPEKAEDDGIFPWKHKEILRLDIPVYDTETAGLGVSVKGKTSNSISGNVDLGIFVKSVIHGGAASRDGRLKTNDQLININGISLLNKSNSEAMETLRNTMHQEGPVPGSISLVIARRGVYSSDRTGLRSGRDSANSLLSQSSGGKSEGSASTPDNSANSENSENTVIFMPGNMRRKISSGHSPTIHDSDLGLDTTPSSNPVVNRLTGQVPPSGLRNQSYYMATNDSWEKRDASSNTVHDFNSPEQDKNLSSPTVNLPSKDVIIIHEDEYPHTPAKNGGNGPPRRPEADVLYDSQTSLEKSVGTFARDQFGRQSMSEKRHATLDAKNTDTFQRNKKAREEREKSKMKEMEGIRGRSRQDFGPTLGMKKSSSLESLQTMVQEVAMQEDGDTAYTYRPGPAVRVVRGRGCNESFRAAVDRSYDAPLGEAGSFMEPLAEEDFELMSIKADPHSRKSSISSLLDDLPCQIDSGDASVRSKKDSKKRSGILKGLGSMFRFGKHRGKEDSQGRVTPLMETDKLRLDVEKLQARKAAQDEQERIQEHYLKLMNERKTSAENPPIPSRTDRISALRAEHQRRHAERHGVYIDDQKETNGRTPPTSQHKIGNTIDEAWDRHEPQNYCHYANFEEIQMYLRNKMRLAEPIRNVVFGSSRERHSQRFQDSDRPVSNYFEYESVQAVIRPGSALGVPTNENTSSLPRHHRTAPKTNMGPVNPQIGHSHISYAPHLGVSSYRPHVHQSVPGPNFHSHNSPLMRRLRSSGRKTPTLDRQKETLFYPQLGPSHLRPRV